MRQKTPQEIEAMALEAPSSAPAVSETQLFGVSDRDFFQLSILRIRQSDRRKHCIVTHLDRINEMTLSMRFPRKRTEAGVISIKMPFTKEGAYQGQVISVAFSDLHRQPYRDRDIDPWVFKLHDHDVSFERYSSGHLYTVQLPVAELWKFAKDWGMSVNMTVRGEAQEELGNMVLEQVEDGYQALVEKWR